MRKWLIVLLLGISIVGLSQPTISSFTPTLAGTGKTVTITGANLTSITDISFGGVSAASFTSLSSTTAIAVVASGASGILTVTTSGGAAGMRGFSFAQPPVVSSFSPTTVAEGDVLTVNGTNFTGASGITLGGVSMSLQVLSSTQLAVNVNNAASGAVTLTTPGGISSLGGLTYTDPYTITSFTPTTGGAGTQITVTGTLFANVSSVTIAGISAASFTVLSSTTLTAIVGAGVSSNDSVQIQGDRGKVKRGGYTYIAAPEPTITSFTPTNAATGATVTITGTNLNTTSAVSFGGISASSFTVVSTNTLLAVVGVGATGTLTVTNSAGSAGRTGFIYGDIASFTPTSAATGQVVTITGSGFNNVTGVTFGGTSASSFTVLSSNTIRAVVAVGSNGTINVITSAGTLSKTGFTFIGVAPTISSFAPLSGGWGTTVTVYGSNFLGVTGISFGGIAGFAINVLSPTTLTVSVGAGSSSGTLSITTIGGSAGQGGFTFIQAPTLTSFTPTSGEAGTSITINGTNLSTTTGVLIGGISATSFSVVSPTVVNAVVATGAVSGQVKVVSLGGVAALSGFSINTTSAPTITDFSPTIGGAGSVISITGTNFNNVTAVQFGGVNARSFVVRSSTELDAVVDTGASGGIAVVNPFGTGSRMAFTYNAALSGPGITSFTPTSATTGTSVTITGTNLSGVTSVRFGDVAARSFIILSDTQVVAVVEAGATGNVTVSGAAGTVSKPGFTYSSPAPPTITSFNPTSATRATFVTITGTNFSTVAAVRFGNVNAKSFVIESPTVINAVVDSGATGSVTVANSFGSASRSGFTYTTASAPVIHSFTPANGFEGTAVTVSGTNFDNITSVRFGDISARSFVIQSPTQLTAIVDAGATGSVFVSNAFGTSSKPGFTYITSSAPAIASFTPAAALSGTTVVITGTNFTGASQVRFGSENARSFIVESSTRISAVVGIGGTGSVTVVNSFGSVSLAGFTYLLPTSPTITSFTPSSAVSGTTITINGTNFTNVQSVKFGQVNARSFIVSSPTQIKAVVDTGASGFVSVTTAEGSINSLAGFNYMGPPLPVITSVAPAFGVSGTTILIKGANFTNFKEVLFGDNKALSILANSDIELTAVLGAGEPGAIPVTVTTQAGSVSQTPFTILAPSPGITPGGPITLCGGKPVTLTSTETVRENRWMKDGEIISNNPGNRLVVTQPGVYRVAAVVNGISSNAGQPITVTASLSSLTLAPLLAGIAADTLTCFTEPLTLTSANTYNNYLWSTGETTSSIKITANTKAFLRIGPDQAGCFSDTSVIVNARKNITAQPLITRISDTLISSPALSYQWLFNNHVASGQTSNRLPGAIKGVYHVRTTADNFCWNISPDYVVVLDAAPVKKAFDMVSYPNPSNGIFNIQLKFDKVISAVIRITLVDPAGIVKWSGKRLLFSDKSIKIPVNLNLSKGIYTLKVDVNGEINTQQMVIL